MVLRIWDGSETEMQAEAGAKASPETLSRSASSFKRLRNSINHQLKPHCSSGCIVVAIRRSFYAFSSFLRIPWPNPSISSL